MVMLNSSEAKSSSVNTVPPGTGTDIHDIITYTAGLSAENIFVFDKPYCHSVDQGLLL